MAIRIANIFSQSLKCLNIPSRRCITINCCLFNEKTVVPLNQRVDLRTEREKLIEKKFQEVLAWYEQFSGLAEVRVLQDRVIKAQDELLQIQELRRNIHNELSQITTKRTELQTKSHNVSREDPEWFSLIREENRLLLEEKKLRNEVQNIERNERDYFTFMCNAVRDSHEKQRWQADRTKYWSLVVTLLSAFITYLISDMRHKKIVQSLVENANKNNPNFKEMWEKINNLDLDLNKNANEAKAFQRSVSTWTQSINKNYENILYAINNNEPLKYLESNAETSIINGPSFALGILSIVGLMILFGSMR